MHGPLSVISYSPVDSARTVARAYSLSLWLVVIGFVALLCLVLWARREVYRQDLVARCGLLAVAMATVGAVAAPAQALMVLPASLSTPVVLLGRAELSTDDAAGTLVSLYAVGALWAAWRLLRGHRRVRRIIAQGAPHALLDEDLVARAHNLKAAPQIVVSQGVRAPFLTGLIHPIIVFPIDALRWTREERQLALAHELAHLRAGDLRYIALSMVLRVVLWFHPAVAWLSYRLDRTMEARVDREVLGLGARPSSYARLLLRTASRPLSLLGASMSRAPLARRLDAILNADGLGGRPVAAAPRRVAYAVTLVASFTIGARELTPSPTVLQALMQESAWQSRAVAATLLAQRPDTLKFARVVALLDPNAQVRLIASRAVAASSPST